MIKLGKKLKVTDIKERMKLLIDGEVFYTVAGGKIEFESSNKNFMFDEEHFCHVDDESLNDHWFCPAKTYTINGVELVDERFAGIDLESSRDGYISNPSCSEYYKEATYDKAYDKIAIELLMTRNLVHRTKEAAIAHTQAMIKVQS
tara:strand:- start:1415 stop:1852 length:438 start_codon:yes stop_codon:yes gene_type:complete